MSDNGQSPERRPRMTMRVYTATADGTVTAERGEVHVMVGEKIHVESSTMAFPPCMCPRCRERNATIGQ